MRRWLIGAMLGALVMALLAWLVVANLPQWASTVEIQGLMPPEGLAATMPAPSPARAWSGPAVACGTLALQPWGPAVPSGTAVSTSVTLAGVKATLSGLAVAAAGGTALGQGQLTVSGLTASPARQAVAPPVYPGFSPPSGMPVIPWPIGAQTSSSAGQPLCLARFGTDALPTVLLGLDTGGAHCCGLVRAYPLGPSGIGAPVDKDLGNPGATVQASGDHALVVTADNAFAYQFSSFGGSGMPVTVWEFTRGAFADTTRQHLDLVQTDATTWWEDVTDPGPGLRPGVGLGILAAWVADECILGQGTHAWATVNGLQVLHRLGGNAADLPALPSGAAYVSALHGFLTQHGYCT
ncbi:MAG TPA: hypothetical protein VFW71_03585 [Actinomycetota bacterium]|nr:hypothetical protein [Actinomycetota bacterium]